MSSEFSWENVRWALTDLSIANWHPVTLLSHVLMAAAFGLDPAPHHIANLGLHLVNCVLVYAVLLRMTGTTWPSLIVALVFAVHPLRAESIVWVSERKGLLCAFFGLLALLAYERYARNPGPLKYLAVLLAFILGLLSKPALIPLPFALLLLDYWPLKRLGLPLASRGADVATTQSLHAKHPSLARVLAEKLLLIAIAVAMTVITFLAQAGSGAVQSIERYPLDVRIANAVISYWMYIVNTFAPFGLTLHYPHPKAAVFESPALYIALPALLLITTFSLWQRRTRPWLIVGWLWFLGMLVPVIGIVQLADQARADRYTYLPQIGLLVMLVWGVKDALSRSSHPRLVRAIVAVWVLAFAVQGFVQTRRWRDDLTLYSYAAAQQPSSSPAHYGLGVAHLNRGEIDAAEQSFLDAISCDPPVYQAFSNLGAIEIQRGNPAKAAEYFESALAIRPNEPDLLVNLGAAHYNLGQLATARQFAVQALALDHTHERARELKDLTDDVRTAP